MSLKTINQKIMKKIVFLTLLSFFIAPFSFASGLDDPASGEAPTPEELAEMNLNAINNQPIENQFGLKSVGEIKPNIENKRQELERERLKMKKDDQKIYKNQNVIREAVHALQAAGSFAGALGQQISDLAQEFNNAVDKTIAAERKIMARGRIWKSIVGGEKDAAIELLKNVADNNDRIADMQKIIAACECDQEVKTVLGDQLVKMQTENDRLNALGENEAKINGFIGWIKSLFN